MNTMESSATLTIVEALTKAIVEHRLQPGAKLAEQKLADHFGVFVLWYAKPLHQLAQNRLVKLEPARGAFVAAPTALEAKQVFAVRRMLESDWCAHLCVPRRQQNSRHCATMSSRRKPRLPHAIWQLAMIC